MRNYDNPNNRYNYREDKKKKKAKNLLWLLLLLLFLSIAMVVALVFGVTNSLFAFTQKMEGDIEFENGIVMTYKDIQVKDGSTFYLIKKDGSKTSALNETNISWGSTFDVISPKISAANGSTPFVLRAKLNLVFTKEIDGNLQTLNLAQLTTALNTELGENYSQDEVVALIFNDMLEFNTGFIDGGDGWFYLAKEEGWTNASETPNLNDMYVFNQSANEVALFKTDANSTTSQIEVISGEEHNMESFYVKSCKIEITVDAVEVNNAAFATWID